MLDDGNNKSDGKLRQDGNARPLTKSVVLVGLMGAGKSCVGRRVSEALGAPFHDSDSEVESAAGCTVTDIFDMYGEPAFRDCERRVIKRLLTGQPAIIATGGGAFIDDETRALVKECGLSIWLRAEPEVLYQRTKRNKSRPLLQTTDPLKTLRTLAEARYPIYGEADIVIETGHEPMDATVATVIDKIRNEGTQK